MIIILIYIRTLHCECYLVYVYVPVGNSLLGIVTEMLVCMYVCNVCM